MAPVQELNPIYGGVTPVRVFASPDDAGKMRRRAVPVGVCAKPGWPATPRDGIGADICFRYITRPCRVEQYVLGASGSLAPPPPFEVVVASCWSRRAYWRYLASS